MMDAWPVIRRRSTLWPQRRILICGPTDFADWDTVKTLLRGYRPSILLHGHATGVDQLASLYAQLFGVDEMRFPAQWRMHGIAAATIRNEQMFTYGRPDLVLIFPGSAHGQDLQRRAHSARVPVRTITTPILVATRPAILSLPPSESAGAAPAQQQRARA
jgi:hypothetical protein